MSSPFLPTTRAQVSGHRFLRRRVEHGLVFGDIRMIHDPLRTRGRGLIFGVVAVVLGMLGAGLFAWLNPQADPGDAVVVRAGNGQLYVRVDERLHPVSNLASARLWAGSPVDPATIGDDHVRAAAKGAPVGIDPAPGLIDPEPVPAVWSACVGGGEITVRAQDPPAPLAQNEAVLAGRWLITGSGRTLLPEHGTPEGRAVDRALGITPRTPRTEVPPEILAAIPEQRPVSVDTPLPEIIDAPTGAWARTGAGVTALTDVQADILRHLGAPAGRASARELLAAPDIDLLALPETTYDFLDVSAKRLCARDDGAVGLFDGTGTPGLTELAGDTPARGLLGLTRGAVGVDTGRGFHVVSAAGLVHPTDSAGLAALGIEQATATKWEIIKLLPEGPGLYNPGEVDST